MLSQVLTRKEQLVLLFLGGSICLGSVVLYSVSAPSQAESTNRNHESDAYHPPATDAPSNTLAVRVVEQHEPESEAIHVSITGAVRAPGLYKFDAGDRVQAAIDAANGTLEGADLSDINLAARLMDGTTLTVPGEPSNEPDGNIPLIRRPLPPAPNPAQYTISGWHPSLESQPGTQTTETPSASAGAIDLNHATQTELETLPGIGPKLATEIIRFREQQAFQTVDDLDLVSGIGPKRLASLRSLVTVEP